jgi:ABC-type glycerol-3-phosphate transport system substrate-binding protein
MRASPRRRRGGASSLVRAAALLLLIAAAAHGQKKTVTFMCAEADLPREAVQGFAAAHPGVALVRVEEDWTRWTAEAAAGSASDLARMGVGTDVGWYAARGLLYDLTPLLARSVLVKMADVDRAGSAGFRFDGRDFGRGSWYGLASGYSPVATLTFNRELFKAAGIAPPSAARPLAYFDELARLAAKLTRRDSSGRVTIWGTDFAAAWVPFLVSDMAAAAGLSFYADEQKSILSDAPGMRGLWAYWTQFPVQDISPNARNPDPGWAGTAFLSDRVAMVQLGYWYGPQLEANPEYESRYGWAPAPVLRQGGRRVTNALGATGIVMCSRTKVPREAFSVLEWYIGGEPGRARARAGSNIPPLLSQRPLMPQGSAYERTRRAVALDDARYLTVWQATPHATWASLGAAWSANIDELVRGSITTDTFFDRFKAAVDAELAAGKQELAR